MVGLLRGLCASLHATVPLLQLMGARARVAIAASVPQHVHAQDFAPPPPQLRDARATHTTITPAAAAAATTATPINPLVTSAPKAATARRPPAPGNLASYPAAQRLPALLHSLCRELVAQDQLRGGVSVSVAAGGRVLCSVSAGFLGVADPRPILPATPMPLLELSAALPVLLLHALISAGVLSLESRIGDVWPAFRCHGKGALTVTDALSRRVEARLDLPMAWLSKPEAVADLRRQWAAVANAQLRGTAAPGGEGKGKGEPPGGPRLEIATEPEIEAIPEIAPSSDTLVHGWLLSAIAVAACTRKGGAGGAACGAASECGGAEGGGDIVAGSVDVGGRCSGASGDHASGGGGNGACVDPSPPVELDPSLYSSLVREWVLSPLGLTHCLWPCELPQEVAEAAAEVSCGFGAQMQAMAAMGGPMAGAAAGMGPAGAAGMGGAAQPTDTGTPSGGGEAGSAGAGAGAGGGMFGGALSSSLGRELPLAPGLVNASAARDGAIPSFGAFGTAEGLALLFSGAARGVLFSPSEDPARGGLISPPVRGADAWASVGEEESMLFGRREWALGMQRFAIQRGNGAGGGAAAGSAGRGGVGRAAGGGAAVVGLHSAGGSVAFFDPDTQVHLDTVGVGAWCYKWGRLGVME